MNWLEKRTLQEAFEKMEDQTKFNFLLWKLMSLENEKIESIDPFHCEACNSYHRSNHVNPPYAPEMRDYRKGYTPENYWLRYRNQTDGKSND
jgi:hypothetical protein